MDLQKQIQNLQTNIKNISFLIKQKKGKKSKLLHKAEEYYRKLHVFGSDPDEHTMLLNLSSPSCDSVKIIMRKFPCLKYTKQQLSQGGYACTITKETKPSHEIEPNFRCILFERGTNCRPGYTWKSYTRKSLQSGYTAKNWRWVFSDIYEGSTKKHLYSGVAKVINIIKRIYRVK